jgi:hypothetical protein
MELTYYPATRRKRCSANDGDTAVATIGIIHNEHGHSLSREGQGGRRQVL